MRHSGLDGILACLLGLDEHFENGGTLRMRR